MELEAKHLTPYLPFQLKAVDEFGLKRIIDWECQSYTNTIVGLNHVVKKQIEMVHVNSFVPIMKSLSKLSNEDLIPLGLIIRDIPIYKATYKDNIFAIEDAKAWIRTGMKPVLSLKQCLEVTNHLLSIHADIFGLIEAGLADEAF
jgi:hypothetical protein